jgi:winged helix DNA-binding protein
VKRQAILAWRMRRQHLTRRVPASEALDVVSDICGLHAQVMSSAQAMLAARAEVDPGYADRALWQDGTLTKTWAVRGTLHLLRTDELPLWTGAQAAVRPRTESPVWLRHFRLTREQAQAILDEVPNALADGPLTREALAAEVARRSGHAELEEKLNGGFGDLLKPVAFRGDLVFAPSEGQRVRFAKPAAFAPLDPEEATREVARRFLSVYGPATREDLAKWFGTPSAAQAGRWLASTEAVEVERGWMLPGDAAEAEREEPSGAVRLLPAFDQYVVASPREDLEPDRRKRVYRAGGWFSPVLLVDGEIAGVWREEDGAIALEPFEPLSGEVVEKAHEEASRLAASGVRLPARPRS